VIRAVLWDFGGVVTESPFDAFARYERQNALPEGFIRQLNAADSDSNAWARLERGEIDHQSFGRLYEAEALRLGHRVDAGAVLALLVRGVRPQMVEAIRRCKQRLKTACLTNNFSAPVADGQAGPLTEIMTLFDVVIESSKIGVRKPDPAFYELACRELAIEPVEAVFLDDLGVNLKPARALGMTTIKVTDPDAALSELEAVVGFPVR